MATLSYLFTEDGEYVCDEVPNVILYWDSAPAEFRCRRASVPGWYPTMSYGKTITTFLKSETVALYRGELPEKKEPTQDVTRIEAIECNIKTIAHQQNVHQTELKDLYNRVTYLEREREVFKPCVQTKPKKKAKSRKPVPPKMRKIKEGR